MSETLEAPPADTTTPPAASAPASSWRDTLPDDLKALPTLAKFQEPGALAKSYVELEKKIGQRGVQVPGEGATPEQVAEFHRALGVPEKPDDYAIAAPEGIPAEVWSDDTAKAFQAKAHALGLTPQQAKGLAEWYARDAADAMTRYTAGIEPDGRPMDEVLRSEWGPQTDRKVDMAKRAASQFGDEAALKALETKIGGAALVKMFAKIGEAMAEDLPAGMGGPRVAAMSPKQEREKLMAPGSPYWSPLHPDHATTMARVKELFAQDGS